MRLANVHAVVIIAGVVGFLYVAVVANGETASSVPATGPAATQPSAVSPSGKIITLGKEAITGGMQLVGFNPWSKTKDPHAAPIKLSGDSARINIHARGPASQNGAEEVTDLIHFDLAKLPKGTKIVSAKLVFPVMENAGKQNVIHVCEPLVAWTDKVDWKTTDGTTAWQAEGCLGEKDRKQVAELAVPDVKYSSKAPTEMSADVTALVKSWLSGGANNGIKLELTGGFINFAVKDFRIEIAVE